MSPITLQSSRLTHYFLSMPYNSSFPESVYAAFATPEEYPKYDFRFSIPELNALTTKESIY